MTESKFQIGTPVDEVPYREGNFSVRYASLFALVEKTPGKWVPITLENARKSYAFAHHVRRFQQYECSIRSPIVYVRKKSAETAPQD